MKKLFTLLFIAISATAATAQTVTGGDMETWFTGSSPSSFEKPVGWYTTDSLLKKFVYPSAAYTPRVTKSTSVKNSGASSAMLVTATTDTLPTILSNSDVSFNFADILAGKFNYKFLGGTAVSKRINFAHAYTQHSSTGSADEGIMNVYAFKKIGSIDSLIGQGNTTITASAAFKKTTVYVAYTETTMVPDRMVIFFLPTKKTAPVAGTTLYVDDVTISDPTGIETPLVNDASVKSYPNPAFNKLHVSHQITESASIYLYNNSGQVVLTQELQNETDIDLSGLAAGNYVFVVSAKISGHKYFSSTFVKQ